MKIFSKVPGILLSENRCIFVLKGSKIYNDAVFFSHDITLIRCLIRIFYINNSI